MQKKYSIKGTYQINDNETKEFEIEYDNLLENEENNKKLFKLLNNPLRLILEGGKFGVNGVIRFFTILFLFALTNTILFIYSIIRLLSSEVEISKIAVVMMVLIIGLGFTFYSVYRTYQYIIIDAMRVIYKNLSSFFQRVSALIIDKVEDIYQGNTNFNDKQLASAVDFGKIVNSKFNKLPKVLRNGIIMLLKRVPFVSMLVDLHEDISKGKKTEASTKLYNKMDEFISDKIFGNNNTRWVFLLLPLNIILLLVLIKLKIG